ncbi:MAG: hypothetical protein R3F11_28830 [Verrucomicrobiales bacterium]
MKTRLTYAFLSAASLLPSAGAAIPETIARPDFQNISGTANAGGVILLNGNIDNGAAGAVPSSGGIQLRESTFGQPGSPFQAPYVGFADQVLFGIGPETSDAVYPQLYPAGYGQSGVTGTRAQIASSSAAFRYKWLVYGEAPDDGTPAILNLFAQGQADDSWFTGADRAKAIAQIAVLREALAYAPLDRQLQIALLDIYYDLAVIDLLLAQKRQVKLAALRLGLESGQSPFIIDDEIILYEEMVALTGNALDSYGELLSFEMEGFELGDVDPAAGGAPFGYWLFKRETPWARTKRRLSMPRNLACSVENVLDPGEGNTFLASRTTEPAHHPRSGHIIAPNLRASSACAHQGT